MKAYSEIDITQLYESCILGATPSMLKIMSGVPYGAL